MTPMYSQGPYKRDHRRNESQTVGDVNMEERCWRDVRNAHHLCRWKAKK